MFYRKKYLHDKRTHNLQAPQIIVEEILKHFSPKSIIDLGCGLGTFVKVFQDHGVSAYGVNGDRVERNKLFINDKYLIVKNLEKFHDFGKKYDLAISLEVAEHIDGKFADNFVKTITSCSDYIIFSAAIPGQGGQNHVNEQPPEYREKKFNEHGYKFYDCFRHIFRNNNDIFRWYKQNMFLVIKDGCKIPSSLHEKCPRYIVHPELYDEKNINSFIKFIKFIAYQFYKLIKF